MSTKAQIWYRAIRKYDRLQHRLSLGERGISRKVNILRKRILRMNRAWKLGVSTASLLFWLGGTAQAQFSANAPISGFLVNGIEDYGQIGVTVSGAGDFNGDGINDFIVASNAIDINGSNSGAAYVIFGSSSLDQQPPFGVELLDGTNGFRILGEDQGDLLGYSAGKLGDINGDSFDDIIIGAPDADPTSSDRVGAAYVIFGTNSATSTLEVSNINGTNGFRIEGITNSDDAGTAVGSAGDFDGDGVNDILLTARLADPNSAISSGQAYVIFGQSQGFGGQSVLNLSALDGTNGFTINGVSQFQQTGQDAASLGDINGDGQDDLLLGVISGNSSVLFGTSSITSTVELSDIYGTNGFYIAPSGPNVNTGNSVAGIGDHNGDGIDDLLITAYRANPNGSDSGQSYVVFGQSTAFSSTFDLSSLNGSNGFIINGIDNDDQSGRTGRGIGDINQDGFMDIALSAPYADKSTPPLATNNGEVYVIFGGGSTSSPVELSALDGTNGFLRYGAYFNERLGLGLDGVGDVNGDGIDDFIVGEPGNSRPGFNYSNREGAAFIIFGQAAAPQPEISVTVSPAAADEDSGQAFPFTFTTSLTSSSSLTVNFSVAGSASSSTDYTLSGADTFDGTDGTVTILAGQTSATIIVTPIGDAMVEPDETIVVQVENP